MGNTKGQGSVYYIKSRKSWVAQYYEYDHEKNKTVSHRKTLPSQEDAKKYLASIMYQKSNPIYIKNNGIPLNELMKALERFKLDTNQISDSQFRRLNETIKRIEKSKIAHIKIELISSDDIQDYFNSLKHLSNSYISKIYGEFNRSFKYAIKKGFIYKNPMDDVIKPKSTKQDKIVRALTFEEQQEFLKLLDNLSIEDEPYKNVFYIQMFLGLRVGEALALKSGDIDLIHNLVNINKTLTVDEYNYTVMGNTTKTYAGIRKVPIPEFLRPIIIEQLEIANERENKMLFLTNGSLVRPTSVNSVLKRLLVKLGINGITSHSLRHTYGTRCIEAGMSPVVLQKLMGHKDVSVTLNTYTSVFNEYKEKELEKVNNYYLNNNLVNSISNTTISLEEGFNE